MRPLRVLTLGLVILTALQGCKRNEPKPLPGPKAAGMVAMAYVHTPGIAWFQGSLDEGFARAGLPMNCREHGLAAPRTQEMARARKRVNLPSPAVCGPSETCPPASAAQPRHRLV